MGFDIGFIDHIHTQPITQLIKTRLVRIVRTAHGIEIVLLHQTQISLDIGDMFKVACARVVFVFIHPANQQGLAIQA